jgi:hypothetical protein
MPSILGYALHKGPGQTFVYSPVDGSASHRLLMKEASDLGADISASSMPSLLNTSINVPK